MPFLWLKNIFCPVKKWGSVRNRTCGSVYTALLHLQYSVSVLIFTSTLSGLCYIAELFIQPDLVMETLLNDPQVLPAAILPLHLVHGVDSFHVQNPEYNPFLQWVGGQTLFWNSLSNKLSWISYFYPVNPDTRIHVLQEMTMLFVKLRFRSSLPNILFTFPTAAIHNCCGNNHYHCNNK